MKICFCDIQHLEECYLRKLTMSSSESFSVNLVQSRVQRLCSTMSLICNGNSSRFIVNVTSWFELSWVWLCCVWNERSRFQGNGGYERKARDGQRALRRAETDESSAPSCAREEVPATRSNGHARADAATYDAARTPAHDDASSIWPPNDASAHDGPSNASASPSAIQRSTKTTTIRRWANDLHGRKATEAGNRRATLPIGPAHWAKARGEDHGNASRNGHDGAHDVDWILWWLVDQQGEWSGGSAEKSPRRLNGNVI